MNGCNNTKTVTVTLLLLASLLVCTTSHANQFRARQHQMKLVEHDNADVIAEIKFGKEVAARILGREQRHTDASLTHYINLIGNTLAMHSSRTELNYYFTIINNEFANAFSAPGGYVFITTGALKLAGDESEVAAILAHEIAHITARHIINELKIKGTDNSSITGITKILSVFSDTTRIAFNQTADKAINILFQKGYKLEEELQADDIAIRLLAETGYDPLALHRYLKRANLQQPDTETKTVKTHPTSTIRFSKLVSLVENEGLAEANFARMENRYRRNTR